MRKTAARARKNGKAEDARQRRAERRADAAQDGHVSARHAAVAAIAGYAAPFVLLATCFALCGLVAFLVSRGDIGVAPALVVGLSALAIAMLILRALLIRVDPPAGRKLSLSEAPAIFKLCDDLRDKLAGPHIHEIYVTDEFSIAFRQAPRIGLFGPTINRLIIGLPMLQALSVDEARAAIAYQIGCVAGGRDRRAATICRMRAIWAVRRETLNNKDKLCWPLRIYVRSFASWFDRLSAPHAKRAVLEADQAAAAAASPQIAADAYLRIAVSERYLDERFWRQVWKGARDSDRPRIAPLSVMARAFRALPKSTEARRWAREALSISQSADETHLPLKERIKALGAKATLRKASAPPAAALLGDFYETMRKKFDSNWKEKVAPAWRETHLQIAVQREKLSRLDRKAREAGRLGAGEAFERASLAQTVLESADARQRYHQAVIWNPGHARAWLELGRLLGDARDERTIACVRRAGDLDPSLRLDAANVAHRFYAAKGETKAAAITADALRTEQLRHDSAMQDIYCINRSAELRPHGLSEEAAAPILGALAGIDGVKHAYLVRKDTDLFDGFYGFHLVIAPQSESAFDYDRAMEQLQSRRFDGHLFFWFAVGPLRWLRKRAAAIDGAALDLTPMRAAAA